MWGPQSLGHTCSVMCTHTFMLQEQLTNEGRLCRQRDPVAVGRVLHPLRHRVVVGEDHVDVAFLLQVEPERRVHRIVECDVFSAFE